jgi:hypothetical protein
MRDVLASDSNAIAATSVASAANVRISRDAFRLRHIVTPAAHPQIDLADVESEPLVEQQVAGVAVSSSTGTARSARRSIGAH